MRTKKIIVIFTLLGLLPFFDCKTYIKIPVAVNISSEFSSVMQGGKSIALVAVLPDNVNMGEYGDWDTTLHGIMTNTLRKYGYFNFVDAGSRKDRLREAAYSKAGVTATQKQLGEEMSIDGLLYIEIPRQPTHSCQVTSRTVSYCATEVYDLEKKKWKCASQSSYIEKFGYLTMNVTMQIRLVNVQTGQYLSRMHSETEVHQTQSNCLSFLEGFNLTAKKAAWNLAAKFSPKITPLEAPVEDGLTGVPDPLKNSVETFLDQGMAWSQATPPSYEKARDNWQKALDASSNTSVSALWNLGLYHWYSGDMTQAEECFKKAEALGKDDFMDSKKQSIRSRFTEEKKRLARENKAVE